MCKRLAKVIKREGIEFDGIYAIPRGGLMVGLYLSHLLNLPLLNVPTYKSLLVDDISDSGNTSKFFKRKKFACLYTTSWTSSTPDYVCRIKTKKDSWVIFCWEDFDTEGKEKKRNGTM
jgi:hypoxanthine phosphoribosyltransferase